MQCLLVQSNTTGWQAGTRQLFFVVVYFLRMPLFSTAIANQRISNANGMFTVNALLLICYYLSHQMFPPLNTLTGSRAAPREIDLDNSILPAVDNDHVRVGTPPRTISLAEHHFPSAADEPQMSPENLHRDFDQNSVGSVEDKRALTILRPQKFQQDLFNTRYANSENRYFSFTFWSNQFYSDLSQPRGHAANSRPLQHIGGGSFTSTPSGQAESSGSINRNWEYTTATTGQRPLLRWLSVFPIQSDHVVEQKLNWSYTKFAH